MRGAPPSVAPRRSRGKLDSLCEERCPRRTLPPTTCCDDGRVNSGGMTWRRTATLPPLRYRTCRTPALLTRAPPYLWAEGKW